MPADSEAAYHSNVLPRMTVKSANGPDRDFSEVRVMVLANRCLRVYRARSFSSAVPFETMINASDWATYESYGRG